MTRSTLCWGLTALLTTIPAQAAPETMLDAYRQAGAGPFEGNVGQAAWAREWRPDGSGQMRSCASCHGTDLTRAGRHARTGKAIEPMAPSVNPSRLADAKKVEKWLRRNCRWTLGRECTAQEKGDFILYISSR